MYNFTLIHLKYKMTKLITSFILIAITLCSITAFGVIKPNQGEPKIIKITPLKKDAFKYYQIEAETVIGVKGEIYLNGKKLYDFNKKKGSLSSNEAQDLIKNGTNEITLKIYSIDKDVEKDYFSKCVVFIALHGVNEKVFPSEESQIVLIKWDPEKDQNKEYIKYVFDLKR